jgi:hypothetical protein
MARDIYRRTSPKRGLYTNSYTEPDMRKELHATFDGLFPEIAKAQKIVLRIMKRGEDGKLIKCACVDVVTGEPDKDIFCPICLGEGFIWNEIISDTYKVVIKSSVGLSSKQDLFTAGLTNIPLVSFYFRHDIPINIINDQCTDKIVELVKDTEGNLVRPYTRQRVYRVGTAIAFRSDRDKLEYWKLDCFGEQVKFLNGPKS